MKDFVDRPFKRGYADGIVNLKLEKKKICVFIGLVICTLAAMLQFETNDYKNVLNILDTKAVHVFVKNSFTFLPALVFLITLINLS